MGYISLIALKILDCAIKGVNFISIELLVLVNVEEKELKNMVTDKSSGSKDRKPIIHTY